MDCFPKPMNTTVAIITPPILTQRPLPIPILKPTPMPLPIPPRPQPVPMLYKVLSLTVQWRSHFLPHLIISKYCKITFSLNFRILHSTNPSHFQPWIHLLLTLLSMPMQNPMQGILQYQFHTTGRKLLNKA